MFSTWLLLPVSGDGALKRAPPAGTSPGMPLSSTALAPAPTLVREHDGDDRHGHVQGELRTQPFRHEPLLDRRARRVSLVDEEPCGSRDYAANNCEAVVSSMLV